MISPRVATSSNQKALEADSSIDTGKTVFYNSRLQNKTSGVYSSYKFSFDENAYYLKCKRGGAPSHVLVLPVCREAIQLFEQYVGNMEKLARRLIWDPRTSQYYIKGFKPPRVDMSENKDKLLPMLNKLKSE